jgi:hypothetical protein
MARAISTDALDIIATGARYTTKLTISTPASEVDGGEEVGTITNPVEVEISDGWSVSEKGGSIAGPRLGVSSLNLLPTEGVDNLFELAGTYGAQYDLSIGIVLGSTIEWVQVFSGKVVEGSLRRLREGVSVSRADDWAWADGVDFDGEHVTAVGQARSTCIVDLFTPVLSNVETLVEATGGYIETQGVYTGSRGQAASDIARDGMLEVGFNGSGQLVIQAQPDAAETFTPDWYFRTDQDPGLPVVAAPAFPPTILEGTLERTVPFAETAINAVTVKPGGSEQTWTAQTVRLEDTLDPRHESLIGFRSVEITSDTVSNACQAWLLAETELVRLLRRTGETVRLEVLLNPAIERGDVIWIAAMPTLDDDGWNGTYIVTDVTHSPDGAKTSIAAITAASYEITT